MKLEYTKPELELELFEVEDVITLSEPGVLDEELDYGELFPNG